MICVSIKPTDYSQLELRFAEATAAGDLIEVRVDALPTIDIEKLKEIIDQATKPILLTLRSKEQGGEWVGSVDEMEKQLLQLAQLNPDYIDIEQTLPSSFIEEIQKKYADIKIVLSYHNFDSTPKDLEGILDSMRRTTADLYKVVTTANSTIDALRVLLFSRRSGGDVIALAMGERGEITRILASVVNTPWTYAALSEKELTAPGQLTVEKLENVYRYSSLNPHTTLCGLIGDPITFSIGNVAHNATYQKLGIDAVYVKMHIAREELKESLDYLKQLNFRGISVTIPHKETVLQYISQVDALATSIGAINTLTFSEKGIAGTNTDAGGALDAIEQHLKVENKHLVIVGAGGAARAVASEGKKRGARVTIVSRRLEQAEQLANDFQVESADIRNFPTTYDILVNATPSELPMDREQILPQTVVMDLKTKPRKTQLLAIAKEKGCTSIYGLEMFTRQAKKQIETWFKASSWGQHQQKGEWAKEEGTFGSPHGSLGSWDKQRGRSQERQSNSRL